MMVAQSFEYPTIRVLKKDEQVDENGELKGVSKYNPKDYDIAISIPERFQIEKSDSFISRDMIYHLRTLRAVVHEDIHWLISKLGVEVDQNEYHFPEEIVQDHIKMLNLLTTDY